MNFDWVKQVLGCAYTYQGSLGMRKAMTRNLVAHHSSQSQDFSYFYKGDKSTVVGNGGDLLLTKHPVTGVPVRHWPEPELAMVLDKNHEIRGYCLANDFTAFELEVMGRAEDFDGTYFGKCWKGSCSLGSEIVLPSKVDLTNLDIGLRVERKGEIIYGQKFSVKSRRREFSELPGLIVDYSKKFGVPPPSKRLGLDENGFLHEGTVVLTGAIAIVPPKCYSQQGDVVTVFSPQIGELTNFVNLPDLVME